MTAGLGSGVSTRGLDNRRGLELNFPLRAQDLGLKAQAGLGFRIMEVPTWRQDEGTLSSAMGAGRV